MKLIIDIGEVDYEYYKETENIPEYLREVLANGILLPKGHGKLIDVKELRQDIIAHKYSNDFCKEHNIDQSINVGMLNILIADAPTIIEADIERNEDGEDNN